MKSEGRLHMNAIQYIRNLIVRWKMQRMKNKRLKQMRKNNPFIY